MQISKMDDVCPNDLLDWYFEEMLSDLFDFREPLLDCASITKTKFLCDALHQDSHVFLTALELVERFIQIKNAKNLLVSDELLLVLTAIFLASKYCGEQTDFKIKDIIAIYKSFTGLVISRRDVKLSELDLINTMDGRLPLHTQLDDLKIFHAHYVKELNLPDEFMKIGEVLLNFFKIHYETIFHSMRLHYVSSEDARLAFVGLFRHRIFVPVAILLCSLKLARLNNTFDVRSMMTDICRLSNIHSDHFYFLSEEIYHQIRLKKSYFHNPASDSVVSI